jgi:hypothetical protein
MRKFMIMPVFVAGVLVSSGAIAQPAPKPQMQMQVDAPTMIANPYGAYEFLIGDWYSKPSGGPDVTIHQNFKWGTNKSYIFYTTLTREGGKPEGVHFEGMLVWNGATKGLDYVIASEPGSGTQEQGTLHIDPDGAVVREVTMITAAGKSQVFRQRFWRTGADTAMTSLMRQTATGWEPNFPGSEQIAMSRRPI